jgi:hypothetical protein
VLRRIYPLIAVEKSPSTVEPLCLERLRRLLI